MNEQLTLDDAIDQQHAAIERAEADVLQLLERLRQIPAAAPLTKQKRSYGNIGGANPWHGAGNLTAQAAVIAADRPLAVHLAKLAGKSLPAPNYEAQQREADRAAAATRLAEQTAQMRAAREARQAAQQARRDPLRGEWDSFHGRWR